MLNSNRVVEKRQLKPLFGFFFSDLLVLKCTEKLHFKGVKKKKLFVSAVKYLWMKLLKCFKANARSVIDWFTSLWVSKFHFPSCFFWKPLRSTATAELSSLIAFAASPYLYRRTCFPTKGSETGKKMQMKAWRAPRTSFTEEQEG